MLQQDVPEDFVLATGITTTIRDFIIMAFDNIGITLDFKGVGIDEADIDKLFRTGVNFSKPVTKNEKGIGLGLLLVNEFVELNKGTIRVSSKLGEVSTFTFSLPAKA